jgi:hypothetical protein
MTTGRRILAVVAVSLGAASCRRPEPQPSPTIRLVDLYRPAAAAKQAAPARSAARTEWRFDGPAPRLEKNAATWGWTCVRRRFRPGRPQRPPGRPGHDRDAHVASRAQPRLRGARGHPRHRGPLEGLGGAHHGREAGPQQGDRPGPDPGRRAELRLGLHRPRQRRRRTDPDPAVAVPGGHRGLAQHLLETDRRPRRHLRDRVRPHHHEARAPGGRGLRPGMAGAVRGLQGDAGVARARRRCASR